MSPTGLASPTLLVTLKEGEKPEDVFPDYGVRSWWKLTALMYVVELSTNDIFRLFETLHQISQDSRVIKADPNVIMFLSNLQAFVAQPNDPYFSDQWYFENITAEDGWVFVYGGGIVEPLPQLFLFDIIPVYTSVHNVRVGVVDTGVDVNHDDLKDVLYKGEETRAEDEENHGTMVAGILGAYTNNNTFIAGMIWTSPTGDRIIPYDYTDGGTLAGERQLTDALTDIVDATREGAVAINASWGFPEGSFTEEHLSLLAYPLYCGRGGKNCHVQYNAGTGECSVSGTRGRGTVLVFAAGNGSGCCRKKDSNRYECWLNEISWQKGKWYHCPTEFGCKLIIFDELPGDEPDQCRIDGFPAACYCPLGKLLKNKDNKTVRLTEPQKFANHPCFSGKLITVSAIDDYNNRVTFSSVASHVTVSAPGYNMLTLVPNNATGVVSSGTSFSAPLVTGLSGLILKLNPNLSVDEVYRIITQTAIDLGDEGRDNVFGYGLINAYRAIISTIFYNEPTPQITPPPESVSIDEQVGATSQVSFSISNPSSATGTLYAVIQISGGDKVKEEIVLPDDSSVRQLVSVISPGKKVDFTINFEVLSEGPIAEDFTLTICTNEGLEPNQILQYSLPVTIEQMKDAGGKCRDYSINVAGLQGAIGEILPPIADLGCFTACKFPVCSRVCLPKSGCTRVCFPGAGWIICPACCAFCALLGLDPPGDPPPYVSACSVCLDRLRDKGGRALDGIECKMCIESKIIVSQHNMTQECLNCLQNIRDFGEVGADTLDCAICLEQSEQACIENEPLCPVE